MLVMKRTAKRRGRNTTPLTLPATILLFATLS